MTVAVGTVAFRWAATAPTPVHRSSAQPWSGRRMAARRASSSLWGRGSYTPRLMCSVWSQKPTVPMIQAGGSPASRRHSQSSRVASSGAAARNAAASWWAATHPATVRRSLTAW